MIKNRAKAEILDDRRQRIAHLEWLEQSSKGWPAHLPLILRLLTNVCLGVDWRQQLCMKLFLLAPV